MVRINVAAVNALYSLLLFSTAPNDHFYLKPTIEDRFVLTHIHVPIIMSVTSFHFASQFFYRYVERKDLKVNIRHNTVYLFSLYCQNLNLVHDINYNYYLSVQCVGTCISPYAVTS